MSKGKFKSILFSILLCGVFSLVEAQTLITPSKCGTVSLPAKERSSLEKMMIEIIAKQKTVKPELVNGKEYKTTNVGTSCVPIKVHDIRDGAGAGSVNMTWLNQDLANLNYHFQAANIEFYFCGTISSVNNATHYEFLTANESAMLTAEPSVTNAFNLYLVNSIDGGTSVAGYAYFPANLLVSTVCIMDKNQLALDDNGTIVHEYGHHFNLLHTHEATENGNADPNAENVPRSGVGSNCTTKGDLLCDTEADPRGTYSGCVYTGGGVNTTDILGNTYTPPMDNIMSYYPNQCGGDFTAGQNTRIMAGKTIRNGHSAYTLTCPATAVTAASGLSAVQAGSQVNLTWTDNAANELGYVIERSTTTSSTGYSSLPMAGVAANVVTYADNTVTSNTTYYYRIKASNGDCNTYSNVATITTGLVYCTPVYSNGGSFCSGAVISNFTFTGNTTINNTSTCVAPAYIDYSSTISSAVTAGVTYNFSVTKPTLNNRYVQIYIDFNQDGDFADANEKILPDNSGTFAGGGGLVMSSSVLIPVTALNGTTKMRVMMKNQVTIGSACDQTSMFFGETEDYALVISGGALPVELISFTGKIAEGNVVLKWSTAREAGNDHFELERSGDGNSFSAIAEIKGAGYTSEITRYETVDTEPLYGKSFYRLKQLNRNNEFDYSDIISVDLFGADHSVQIAPNPTAGSLNIEFETWSETAVSLEMQDITGRILISESLISNSGLNAKELTLQSLSEGIYFLRVKVGETLETFRVIKQ